MPNARLHYYKRIEFNARQPETPALMELAQLQRFTESLEGLEVSQARHRLKEQAARGQAVLRQAAETITTKRRMVAAPHEQQVDSDDYNIPTAMVNLNLERTHSVGNLTFFNGYVNEHYYVHEVEEKLFISEKETIEFYSLDYSQLLYNNLGPNMSYEDYEATIRRKSGLVIISRKRNALVNKIGIEEYRARSTLRDILTESQWRKFVRDGFILVRGKSGKAYQVFHNGSRTIVWEKNKKIASICIHTDQVCPPTDHLINMKFLIEMDEDKIWKEGNVAHQTLVAQAG